jgi:hypothetical protein
LQLEVGFTPALVEFAQHEQDSWFRGDRAGCLDDYCSQYGDKYGLGESRVGRAWDRLGFGWIHHDYSVFGGNKLGTFPKGDAVLREILGAERSGALRRVYSVLKPLSEPGHGPFEEPDLLIYRRTTGEVRFAECKRAGTPDRLNPRQALGMWLLSTLLGCPVDYCLVAQEGTNPPLLPVSFRYEWLRGPLELLADAGIPAF